MPMATAIFPWFSHVLLAGGGLLLFTALLVCLTRQPVRRAWLGDWGTAAALLIAIACLGPSWWVIPGDLFSARPPVAAPPPPAMFVEAPEPVGEAVVWI